MESALQIATQLYTCDIRITQKRNQCLILGVSRVRVLISIQNICLAHKISIDCDPLSTMALNIHRFQLLRDWIILPI